MIPILFEFSTAAISFALSYLLIGSVTFMLLVDEIRFKASRVAFLGFPSTDPGFWIASVLVILEWPVVFYRMARKVVGR